jgi:2-polyprenyl-3-methyl-5-hydroxy-6-metoxy-1,4-benzoquinol methylase
VASSKYDTVVDLADRNNSHTLMVELVGANKRVLDVGCANGYLAEVLGRQGCTVSGVEYDAAAAEEARAHLDRLVVGDLETLDLAAELGTGGFDVVVFGDVLEHLRDPLPVLKQARALLAPGGYVVISIPNVAHGSVRLSLLKGRFDYGPLGLLDETHIRFFTRDNLRALLRDAGFAATDFLRTTAGVFETELRVKAEEFDPQVVEQVLADPDALTYQFVVRAVPDDASYSVTAMREQFEQRLEEAVQEIAALTARVEAAERRTEDVRASMQAELTAMHEQVVSRDAEIARLDDLRLRLQATRSLRAATAARSALGRVRGLAGGPDRPA